MRGNARTRVAVIGVGQLGSRHARVYSELESCELVAVADIDGARASEIASAHGGASKVKAVTDFHELIPDVEAASVAVPTEHHREVSLALLDAGVHVLVEKPIAAGPRDAEALVSRAREKKLCLAVGHTERYNPAVQALIEQSVSPRFIEVHRLGSFSPRSLDIDVVLDLMIHDLDVVTALVGRSLEAVEAVGVPVLTPRVDIANARLKFEGGAVANITASRVSQDKVRKLRVFERDRYVSLDYQNQEAVRYRLVPSEAQGGRPAIERDELAFERAEPLKVELSDFLEAVRGGGKPRVTGEDGAAALGLALRVVEAMGETG